MLSGIVVWFQIVWVQTLLDALYCVLLQDTVVFFVLVKPRKTLVDLEVKNQIHNKAVLIRK